jgi:hypothetical protein
MASYETSVFETFDTKSLLLFYILLSANFLDDLLGHNIVYFVKKSWFIKNILAIIVLYVFVVLTNDKINDYNILYQFTLVFTIYIWFYLTRYMNFSFLAIVFLLLLWILIITNRINRKKDDKPIIFDFHLSIEQTRNMKNIIFYFAIFLTIWGVICYIGEYKTKYHKFDFKKIFITRHGYQIKHTIYGINDVFRYTKNAFLG